jgi:P27 family predicted phage terminase small subunit
MPKMKISSIVNKRLEVILMARPAKAIDTNSMKMSKQERKTREESEKKLRGNNDKIKPFTYLTKRQKAIFKDILKNLNPEILSNLDTYLLNQTAITIERLESIEKEINSAGEYTDSNGKKQNRLDAKTIINLKSVRDMYSKDFFRCCNELSLSPQARAKISINTQPTKKKTLMDILNDDDNEE